MTTTTRGTVFTAEGAYFVEVCCNCSMPFAMLTDFKNRRAEDRKSFYCPAGHGQHYTGKTEAEKLKDELERERQQRNAAEARAGTAEARAGTAEARACTAEADKRAIASAHLRMRRRVANGVCPCCNRTFQNLLGHMRTEHPEFAGQRSLLGLRQAFGMTQHDVAREAGVQSNHVSLYERGQGLKRSAREALDYWVASHDAKNKEPA